MLTEPEVKIEEKDGMNVKLESSHIEDKPDKIIAKVEAYDNLLESVSETKIQPKNKKISKTNKKKIAKDAKKSQYEGETMKPEQVITIELANTC